METPWYLPQALIGLVRPELVAVHAEAQGPGRHGEQEAAAFARAPTMVAAAAAGFDVDEHHIASAAPAHVEDSK